MPSSHSLDTLVVDFDDDHAVANAGLLLPATLADRLGIEPVIDELVDLGDRPGAHRPGRKVLTLIHALMAGGDCIDDADLLRTGSTAKVLGHQVMAPSTLGTFLRSFTFGHIRQLDRVAETIMGRAWAAGAGPGTQPMTIDLDSTSCEVHGHHKAGAMAATSGPPTPRHGPEPGHRMPTTRIPDHPVSDHASNQARPPGKSTHDIQRPTSGPMRRTLSPQTRTPEISALRYARRETSQTQKGEPYGRALGNNTTEPRRRSN